MTSPPRTARLRFYSLGVLAGIAIGFVVHVATSNGLETITGGRIGGDLPAFYGAGRIVRAGNVRSLYDATTQRAAQEGLLPHSPDGWIHFAYPPPVALIYAPLTVFSFKTAYVLHTVLMVACCILAVWHLRHSIAGVDRMFWVVVAAVLTFYPLFRAVMGGQNSAVSILLAAAAISALKQKRDVLAGLWLGAWLFKPQLAVPVILATCVSRPRILLGVLPMGALYYVAGVSMAGFGWPIWWAQSAAAFAVADRAIDAGNGISFVEITAERGVGPAGWLAAATMAVVVLRMAHTKRSRPAAIVGLSAAAAPLVAPHALFYDGALALIALVFPAESARRGLFGWLAAVWVLGAGESMRGMLGVPFVSIALLVAFVACERELRRSSATTSLSS